MGARLPARSFGSLRKCVCRPRLLKDHPDEPDEPDESDAKQTQTQKQKPSQYEVDE